jgi:hypothetical protein
MTATRLNMCYLKRFRQFENEGRGNTLNHVSVHRDGARIISHGIFFWERGRKGW